MTNGASKAMLRATGGLFAFGCGYAYLVRKLGDKHAGYTWVLVVIGDAVVILSLAPVIGWSNALKLFIGFAAAGLPMSLENIILGVQLRERYQRILQDSNLKLADRGKAKPLSEVRDDRTAKGSEGSR